MFYSFDSGKVRMKSFQSGNEVIHELRHYGSVINTFRTDTPKSFLPRILEEHFSTLTVKSFYKDPIKRFAITQLGVDLVEAYMALTGEDLQRVCQQSEFGYWVRDFDKLYRAKESALIEKGTINVKLAIQQGNVVFHAMVKDTGQTRFSFSQVLPFNAVENLRGKAICDYISPLLTNAIINVYRACFNLQ